MCLPVMYARCVNVNRLWVVYGHAIWGWD